jgi:hypothetical protein
MYRTNKIKEMKTEKTLIAIGWTVVVSIVFLIITAATVSITPAPYGNLTKVTSRDGITVYHYGNCVIVKTSNSISITNN